MVTVPFKFPSCQVFLRETRDKGTHRIIASKPARTHSFITIARGSRAIPLLSLSLLRRSHALSAFEVARNRCVTVRKRSHVFQGGPGYPEEEREATVV